MNTNPIQRLIDLGLPVGWRTLFVGRAGPADILVDEQLLLDEKVVIDFAMDQVSNGSDDKRAIELAGSSPMERDYIWKTLASLAEDEKGTDFETERRKWRVLLLRELLERLPDEFVDGLSELTSFWAGFGYPADGPHTVQGRGNNIPPRDYYTKQNFEELKMKHRQWIEAELADLRKSPAAPSRR